MTLSTTNSSTIARRRTRITRQHSAPNLSEDTEVTI